MQKTITGRRHSSAPFAVDSGKDSVNTVIIQMAGEFCDDLQRLAKSGDAAELKTALRTHISVLEELYVWM